MSRVPHVLILAALLSAPAAAQSPDWSHAAPVTIALSSFKFTPDRIVLKHGEPYRLHFTNTSSGGHDFAAREFFAAATIAPDDRATLSGGKIELGEGESADVRLIPGKPGSYPVHCSHFLHSSFGMVGTIVVE